MNGIDVSEWQAPGSVDFTAADFAIIRASHGTTEDRHWREHFNACVAAGKPLGLYHYFEKATPEAEASFFHNLVAFLQADQVHRGFWLDSEEQRPASDVDRFRSWVRLPWCGLYSNLAGYNGPLVAYQHFALNWLAMPDGTTLPPGWAIPDHIMRQTGIRGGIDQDVTLPAQPYPPAWSG